MEKRLTADLNVVANSNLEIQLLDGDLNVIQKLDDEPNDVGGLTSAELKAKFDESGNIIKKYINETLIPAVLAEDATEESRKQAEAARVAAEQGRVTAEEGRVSAEAARAAAEQARSEAEPSRVSAENTRAQAETARASAEASRSQDEAARNSAESTRQANETARQNAESARQMAETNRAQTETARNVWEDYDSAKNYQPGNKVYWQGSSYVCLKPCSGISPENGTYWQLVVRSGFTSDSAFGFDVVNGRLLCYYSGDNPPPFRLGDDGHLYVDLDKTYDLGKVTGGSGSGGGESDVFYAIYGTTTLAEIKAAHDAGKAVYMKKGTSRFVYPLITLADSFAQFAFVSYSGDLRRCTCQYVDRDVWKEDEPAPLAEKPVSTAVTLSASGWNSSSKTQTVTVSGVLADETKQLITPTPAIASQTAYYNAGIRCTGQAANELTFTAKTIPTADLTVYVTIQEVKA